MDGISGRERVLSESAEMCSAPPCKPHGGAETGEQVPLDNAVSGRGAGPPSEGESAAPPVFVRGKPASWVVVPIIKKTVFPNAFGADEEEQEQRGASHLIEYDGKRQSRGEFLERLCPGEYKKYPYKVCFKTDDIFRLGGN